MKDVYAYHAEGTQTIVNKVHPELSAIIDMLENKDYYGTEIRNSNDPLVKQFGDIFQYQAGQFVPFTVKNLINRQQAGDSSWNAYVQSFIGITPAPAYITRTPLQREIYALYDRRFGGGIKTGEQSAAIQLKAKIRQNYWLGDKKKALEMLQAGIKDKTITPQSAERFAKEINLPSDIKLFRQLPDTDQIGLLRDMQLYELNRYAWYAKKDVLGTLKDISDNTRTFVEMVRKGEVKYPVWKSGQLAKP
jgi:hypothetical protein